MLEWIIMDKKLSKKILELTKNKFYCKIIICERGYGMSTYAMKLMSEVYSRDLGLC